MAAGSQLDSYITYKMVKWVPHAFAASLPGVEAANGIQKPEHTRPPCVRGQGEGPARRLQARETEAQQQQRKPEARRLQARERKTRQQQQQQQGLGAESEARADSMGA